MRQIFGFWYALFLLCGLSLLALARSNDGAVLILSFDGDAIHMAQIVLRMADGQIPHQDFVTPLGIMAFLPIVWLVQLGAGIGMAFAYAPVLIGVFLAPMVYWVGLSRLSPSGALAFGALVLVSLMSFVHGGTEATVAASMYYNTWCWAVAAVVVVLSALPSNRPEQGIRLAEPLILGACMAFLVLTKATFAVFLAPAIVCGLVVSGQTQLLVKGAAICLGLLIIVTLPYGFITYWQGYVQDLLFVSQSVARAKPGDELAVMVLRPDQIVGVLGLIAGFVLLRQARMMAQSLVFLLLGIGWILVSHQNWQNDPHWLVVAGLVLFGMGQDVVLYNRFGWPLQTALRSVAVVLLAAGAPLWMAQVQSVLVHNGLKHAAFSPAFSDPRHDDLRFRAVSGGPYSVTVAHPVLIADATEPAVFEGITLPTCQKANGLVAELVQTGAALDALPQTHGAQVFYADWVNALWLFSKTEPLQGGAPWYYGGTTGFENAQFLVVPKCPMGQVVRGLILKAVTAEDGLTATLDAETPLFYLFRLGR